MESKRTIDFDATKSKERIDNILKNTSISYEELDYIPDRRKLTFENGFYINTVGAIFIDIRNSSELPTSLNSPKLGRLYRSYISEVTALLSSYDSCKEINIIGDCVSGIFDCRKNTNELVCCMISLNYLIYILNAMLDRNGITTFGVGVGASYGRVLMLKAGFSGSKVNDIVWIGNTVNEASNLCNKANKNGSKPVLVDARVVDNLDKELTGYFDPSYPFLFDLSFKTKIYENSINKVIKIPDKFVHLIHTFGVTFKTHRFF